MYNHSDSYPEWLGRRVLEFVQSTTDQEMNEIFDRIIVVTDKWPDENPPKRIDYVGSRQVK